MNSMDRRQGLGGSDMAAVMGVDKYRTPLQVFLQKTGILKDSDPTRFTYWGNRLEELVADEFSIQSGKKVQRLNRLLRHPEHSFITGNIDRRIVGEPAVLECKTASAYKADDWDGAAPINYIIQLQHYLMLTGAERGYFAVLIGGNDFRHFEMKRDDGLIADIESAAKNFWLKHVVPGVPPEATAGDNEILLDLYRDPSDEVLEMDDEWELACRLYLEAHEIEKSAKERKSDISAKMKAFIGSNKGLDGNRYTAKWNRFERVDVDIASLRAAHPEIVKNFIRTSPSGSLRITERKSK